MAHAAAVCEAVAGKSVTQCFPLEQSWHQMYRDFEEDPYLGGKSKCVKGTQTGDFVGDSAVVVFEYPPDGIKLAVTTDAWAPVSTSAWTGKGCSLWVTGAELGQQHSCCEYIFELLCGFHPTYQIYDESCQ
ncbi:uncharacterized protein LOC142570559 [Dermacentor variabilis]|uniref:uncharacterized protein LOC142570559 n=1 Tax=Dermacentor variabilis TaxID=34621 RepID=UPI003F5B8954